MFVTFLEYYNTFAIMLILCPGYATALGFIGYTITLLVMAPKADPSFVFIDVNNDTG